MACRVEVRMSAGKHGNSEVLRFISTANGLAKFEHSCRGQEVDRRVREDDPPMAKCRFANADCVSAF